MYLAWALECVAIKKYFHRITKNDWVIDHEFVNHWGQNFDLKFPLNFKYPESFLILRNPKDPRKREAQEVLELEKPTKKVPDAPNQSPPQIDNSLIRPRSPDIEENDIKSPALFYPPDKNLDELFA